MNIKMKDWQITLLLLIFLSMPVIISNTTGKQRGLNEDWLLELIAIVIVFLTVAIIQLIKDIKWQSHERKYQKEQRNLCGNKKCNKVKIGDYSNQSILTIPKNIEIRYNRPENDIREIVCIDTCLTKEITALWNKGIVTTGCCCGHNKKEGYIGVKKEYADKMLKLGYVQIEERIDEFYPKFKQ